MAKKSLPEMVMISKSMVNDNPYVCNTLEKCFEVIVNNNMQAPDLTGWLKEERKILREVINHFGAEATYVFCMISVYRYMYKYDNGIHKTTDYQKANYYKHLTDNIDKKIIINKEYG